MSASTRWRVLPSTCGGLDITVSSSLIYLDVTLRGSGTATLPSLQRDILSQGCLSAMPTRSFRSSRWVNNCPHLVSILFHMIRYLLVLPRSTFNEVYMPTLCLRVAQLAWILIFVYYPQDEYMLDFLIYSFEHVSLAIIPWRIAMPFMMMLRE